MQQQINDAVEEALHMLDTIYSNGRMDYSDYYKLYCMISEIAKNG